MKLDNLSTIDQMETFLTGSQPIAFAVATGQDERYQFIQSILKRFGYSSLKRSEKGVVIRFLGKVSGYSRQQLTRLIHQYFKTGKLKRHQKTMNGFERVYTDKDIQLLAQLDQRHDTPNGYRVKKLCERAYLNFNDGDYVRLSTISISYIYNLRKLSGYL